MEGRKEEMNKLLKGTIAAGAGVALLLGGMGTFALWQDDWQVGTDDTLTAGRLDITDVDGTWTWGSGPKAGQTIDPVSDVLIVPGDVLVYTAGVTYDAEGDNLAAEWGVDTSGLMTADGPLAEELDVALTSEPADVELGLAQTDDVSLTITYRDIADYGNSHDAMGLTVDLEGITITLSQVLQPTP
jgi:alternate signal-mediated exported protein